MSLVSIQKFQILKVFLVQVRPLKLWWLKIFISILLKLMGSNAILMALPLSVLVWLLVEGSLVIVRRQHYVVLINI
jgi:hypothetical protein